jgi:Ca2+-binding EF-hand superfamily protein
MGGNFQQLDRNRDGYLTASELAQHANRMAQSGQTPVEVVYIWVTGANRGQPSLSDLQNAYAMLQKVDEDNDGHITRSELRDTQTKVASQMVENLFNRLDQNQDEEISQDEASGTLLGQRFNQLDTDNNGYLTSNELKKDFQRELNQQTSVSQSQDQSGESRR